MSSVSGTLTHMLDWLGSLRLREHTSKRVTLELSQTTRFLGIGILCVGLYTTLLAWRILPILSVIPGFLMLIGSVLMTLRRQLVFDRDSGVLRVDTRALFLKDHAIVPLFHLRAVVIVARPNTGFSVLRRSSRYIAYIERRRGDAIYLDEARRCRTLLHIAQAISDVAEVRLEYDAMSRAMD